MLCSGGPLPGTPVSIHFAGPKAVQSLATITTVDSLTGGSSPTSSVSVTMAGAAPDTTIALKANVPLPWDSQGYFAQPFAADVSMLRVTNTSGVDATLKIRTVSSAS